MLKCFGATVLTDLDMILNICFVRSLQVSLPKLEVPSLAGGTDDQQFWGHPAWLLAGSLALQWIFPTIATHHVCVCTLVFQEQFKVCWKVIGWKIALSTHCFEKWNQMRRSNRIRSCQIKLTQSIHLPLGSCSLLVSNNQYYTSRQIR